MNLLKKINFKVQEGVQLKTQIKHKNIKMKNYKKYLMSLQLL